MAALLNAVIAEGDKTAFQGHQTAGDINGLFVAGPDSCGCALALAENRLLGFQALSVEYLRGTGWADISTFVTTGSRGTGTGRALWQATQAQARAQGLAGLRAVIRSVNSGAIAFYSACGFAPPKGDLPDGVAITLQDRTVLVRALG